MLSTAVKGKRSNRQPANQQLVNSSSFIEDNNSRTAWWTYLILPVLAVWTSCLNNSTHFVNFAVQTASGNKSRQLPSSIHAKTCSMHLHRHTLIFTERCHVVRKVASKEQTRAVRNLMKILDIVFLKTEPNWPQNSKTAVRFSKNRLQQFGDSFSRCFIHNSSCSMTGSTVTVFFFMPYLWTFGSESLRLTIGWTNSARKYVISSIIHIKQHTVQKTEPQTKAAVNLVKPKAKWKLQFFGKLNRSHFLLTAHP